MLNIRRKIIAALCAFCAVLGAGTTSVFAQPAPAAPSITPLITLDQTGAIPLLRARSENHEQWEEFGNQRIVRNVTAPNLTPVLPDPARATGAAVIIAPGGGFLFLSMDNEGFLLARWLADHGIAAFVLKYRTRPTPADRQAFLQAMHAVMLQAAHASNTELEGLLQTPPEALSDAQAAVRLVRERAPQWRVDPNRVGFVGFSAGAITALSVGLARAAASRPNFIASIYGPLFARAVPADAPPMFLAVALDDPLMARGRALDLVESWRAAGRLVEAHFFERGGHGFGMVSTRPASAMWIDEFYAWMRDAGFAEAGPANP